MGGRRSNGKPGATSLFGPAKLTGLARSDQWGSVRILSPSSWISSVAWPIHVTVGIVSFLRKRSPSLWIGTSGLDRGCTAVAQSRDATNAMVSRALGAGNAGLGLR